MASVNTKIEWTDRTWNPVQGCQRVSPGCQNCYAEKIAYRFSGEGEPFHGLARKVGNEPRWTGLVRTLPDKLQEPLHWRKPSRIFVNSMSDLFHEDVPFEFIAQVFEVMYEAKERGHIFQVLTKRPERMRAFMEWFIDQTHQGLQDIFSVQPHPLWGLTRDHVRRDIVEKCSHVWLGVSVEDQKRADERIPILIEIPAAVRFLSCEPLFETLDLSGNTLETVWVDPELANLDWGLGEVVADEGWPIHWVICGGESGNRARPMPAEAAIKLAEDCHRAGIPFFFKQTGSVLAKSWKLKDAKGGNLDEIPDDKLPAIVKVRQFPKVAAVAMAVAK
jgi:protein gp37